MGEGERDNGRGEAQSVRSIIGRHKIGEVKHSIGNREAKELVCMTHGHELRVGECWRVGGCREVGG